MLRLTRQNILHNKKEWKIPVNCINNFLIKGRRCREKRLLPCTHHHPCADADTGAVNAQSKCFNEQINFFSTPANPY